MRSDKDTFCGNFAKKSYARVKHTRVDAKPVLSNNMVEREAQHHAAKATDSALS